MKRFYMVILMVILGGMVTGTAMGVPLNNATGSILISSTPPGAAVYLDSQYQGVTPESSSFIEIPNLLRIEIILFKELDIIHYFRNKI